MTLLSLIRPELFDLKTAVLAKHAQHVVFIHFPIALFITAVAFDLIGHLSQRRSFADAAYFNLLVAAIATIPTLASGVLAWQLQLEGQKLKGTLLLHLVLGCVSGCMIGAAWWLHFRTRSAANKSASPYRIVFEALAVLVVMATAHLGGFLSGVNVPS
jgi:uncharacterized membrane protein